MKHTAGPWKVSDGSVWGTSPLNARVRLADVRKHASMNGIDSEANANLIAAAPEMLEALEMALIGLKQIEDPLVETSDALIEVRRAIKKARGEK